MHPDDFMAGLAPRTGEVLVGGRLTAYLQWGESGPDIALIHGLTSSARTWWRLAPDLARLGYRVCALDLPGHGRSESPGDYAFVTTARTVDGWMEALGLRAPIVVGHSWGGALALVQATEPDTAVAPSRLVLLDPLLQVPAAEGNRYREAMRALCGKPCAELQPMLRDSYRAWHDGDVLWKAEALELTRPSAVDGVFDDNPGLGLVERLPRIRAPWTIIAGDPMRGSIIFADADEHLAEIARANGGAFVRLPGLPHDIYREDYDATWVALLKALG